MIVSKTPLRISFVGGGTDLPSFYRSNSYGAVVSASVNSYVYVSIKSHSEIFQEKIRLNYYDSEVVDKVSDIKNTIIREALKLTGIEERIYIATVSDVPASTGLGSSSTFAVGLLNALYRYKGMRVSRGQLAEEASHIEIDILKSPIGKQDQYAAAFGGLNYIKFNKDDTVSINPIHLSADQHEELFRSMISFWTGVTRSADSILSEQEKKNTSDVNIRSLIAMRDQADLVKDTMNTENFDIQTFGKLIHEGWTMKKSLASKISNNSIDKFYEEAMNKGAFGGKISGAGGGGFLNLFADTKYQEAISNSMVNLGLMPCNFKLDTEGTTVYEI